MSIRRQWFAAVLGATAWLTGQAHASDAMKPTHLSLPDGPASIQGLGGDFKPSAASGTASYAVSLALPSVPGGFAPELALTYDGGRGASEVGLGWRLSGVPSLRRRTQEGLPRFDESDTFEVVGLGTTSELLEVSSGVYRPEHEDGSFVRVTRSGAGWELRTKQGITYRFGGNGCAEAEGTKVARWLLREQEDRFGHKIAYEWATDGGWARLKQVTVGSGEAAVTVRFTYEARSDRQLVFSQGLRQELTERLAAIDVERGGEPVRSYRLGYAEEPTQTLLTSMQLTGADGKTTLPTLGLEYTALELEASPITMTQAPGISPAEPDAALVDLDGDSLPDLLIGEAGSYRSYLNQDGQSWREASVWSAADSPSLSLSSVGVQLADLDGDGAVDLVAKSGTSSFRYLPSVDGTHFGAAKSLATVPSFSFEDPEVRLADLDGDRRTDVVLTAPTGLYVSYNRGGTDWTEPALVGEVDPAQPLSFSDGHTELCDLNGDGVQDLCYLRSEGLTYWLGRGRGVFEPAAECQGVPAYNPTEPYKLVDLDGNGWPDLVRVGVSNVFVAMATALGEFGPVQTVAVPSHGPDATVQFQDMNASGTTDLLWVDVTGSATEAWKYLELFPKGRGGLLRRIDNGLGKLVTIDYEPAALGAARAREEGQSVTTRLNTPMPVVRRVTVDASLGEPSVVTEYDHRLGTWDPAERTLAGFGRAIETAVGDGSTPTLVTDTTYDTGLTDRILRGQPLIVERRAEDGTLFDRTTTSYQSVQLQAALDGRHVKYAYASSTLTEVLEGSAAGKTLLTEWEQDEWGNVTREAKWGQVEGDDELAGEDEAITLRTFANDADAWTLGFVASEELQDGRGARVALKRTYYDGEPFVGLGLGKVTQGLVRRVSVWTEGDTLLDQERYDHDTHGNVTVALGATGGRTELTYDPTGTFVVTERRQSGEDSWLQWKATWDSRFGAITSLQQPTGSQITLSYDALGRIERVVQPGDTEELPTTRYEYRLGSPLSQVVTHSRVLSGQEDELLGVSQVDGLGRKRGVFAEGAKTGTWLLSGLNAYDARGQLAHEAYATEESSSDLPSDALDRDGTTTLRDALGRELVTRHSDQSESRKAYGPLTVTLWDENDADPESPHADTPTTRHFDGLQRLVQVQERDGQRTLTTGAYTYDAAGKLLTLTDAAGSVRRYQYDGLGRRTRIEDPNAGTWKLAYDAAGNPTRREDPTGRVVTHDYDLLSRPLHRHLQLPSGEPVLAVTWHYDEPSKDHAELGNTAGQLAWVQDEAGAVYYGYDARGRGTDELRRFEDGTSYRSWRDFDAGDRPLRRGFPDQTHLSLTYDAAGRLSSLGPLVTDLTWSPEGNLLSAKLGNGVTETRHYDERRRLDQLSAKAADGTLVRGLKYSLDAAGHVLGRTDLREGVSKEDSLTAAYTLDDRYRLTKSEAPHGSIEWELDDVSKILSVKSDLDDPHLNVTNKYGEGKAGPDALTHHGDESLTWDKAGRLTKDGERELTWDAQGRLTKVVRGKVTEEYVYDHTDKRTVKRTTEDGHTKTTRYITDDYEVRDGEGVRYASLGSERVVRLDPVDVGARTNGGAKPAALPPTAAEPRGPLGTNGRGWGLVGLLGALTLLASHYARRRAATLPKLREALLGTAVIPRGPPRIGPRLTWSLSSTALCGLVLSALGTPACSCSEDKPGARDKSVEITEVPKDAEYYLSDIQGSPLATLSSTGAVTSTTAYHPYGAARRASGEAGDPWGFVGNEEDRGSGLSDFRARPYRPELGVFLAVDPVALFEPEKTVEEPFRALAYVYGGGGPETNVDRDGKFAIAIPVILFAEYFMAGAEIVGTAAVVGEATVVYGAAAANPNTVTCYDSSSCSGRQLGDQLYASAREPQEAKSTGGSVRDLLRTSRAARREAMRRASTPTSRPATAQRGEGGRKQYVTEGHDGKPRVQTQHPADEAHPDPHWHDASPKTDEAGNPRENSRGEIKYQKSGSTTVPYGG